MTPFMLNNEVYIIENYVKEILWLLFIFYAKWWKYISLRFLLKELCDAFHAKWWSLYHWELCKRNRVTSFMLNDEVYIIEIYIKKIVWRLLCYIMKYISLRIMLKKYFDFFYAKWVFIIEIYVKSANEWMYIVLWRIDS